ncbi:hypothetical protein GCM10010347_33640 [Streptomyces cirratus]|uniref:Integral membrane protein n=1 Tax=Streptomyces cirratus TaxID=68187 RepID=A0ABQ3F179_9ACTN|nr:hypothetical protein [Streptomyces cirratus]GHB60850.1 hypothetical protein GCM10010347_33640 [Streptomyces cirratus]
MTVYRYTLGALGLLLAAVGARLVAVLPDPLDVLVWLGGALVLHDAVIAPLVLGAGLLTAALPARGLLRGTLLTGGAVLLVTLPLLLRPGGAANPSALPLPYGRNLLLVLGAVAVAAGLLAAVRAVRSRGRRRRDA